METASIEKMWELMRWLEWADEAASRRALAQLNNLGRGFDFSKVIHVALPAVAQAQAIKCLRVMSGTNSLGESRAALMAARRIIAKHAA
jgi:hypothetical protein